MVFGQSEAAGLSVAVGFGAGEDADAVGVRDPYLLEVVEDVGEDADGVADLLRIDDRNLITQRMGRTTFAYDANGRLGERVDVSDLGTPHPETWRWTYDRAGNPLSRDFLRDGTPVRHSEYVYAEGTLFLKAVITRDLETGLIEMVRYETGR